MTTAEDVLRVARAEIGYVEAPNGANKYGAYYGMDRVAWCAEFQWWVFNHAGAGNLIPKTAYTPTFYGWFQSRGQAGRTPRPGALVFYDWPGDGLDRISHVGIVEAVNRDGSIVTIEGNTSGTAAGSQRNGGVVARKTRRSGIVGYGYPAYSGVLVPPPPPPPSAGNPNSLPTLQYGMRNNPAVASFQRWSNAYPWSPELPVVPPTGNYLDQTRALVKRIQAKLGVTGPDADGSIIGPRTKAAVWNIPGGWRG